jgi:hypothetical protein
MVFLGRADVLLGLPFAQSRIDIFEVFYLVRFNINYLGDPFLVRDETRSIFSVRFLIFDTLIR